MPTERTYLAVAMVRNTAGQSILYAIGGRTSLGSVSRVEAYNAATNTWTRKAELPTPLYQTNGAGVIDGKIYVSGGLINVSRPQEGLYVYDPATNTWASKRSMPIRSWGGVTGVIDNKLYVVTSCDYDACDSETPTALYRYDPVTDQWASLPKPPATSALGVGGTIARKLYVTGDGLLHVYDPATNQWTSKGALPRPSARAAGATLGAKLYRIGGVAANGSVDVYDPATDTWTALAPLPTSRSGIAAARVIINGQSRIEVVGGARPDNNLAYIP